MTEKSKIELAAIWAAEEYERRTLNIATGKETGIYFMCPSTRVSWHEICGKFEMKVCGPIDRVDFQPLFRREMRRRKLLKVLSGQEKSDQWAKRTGKM
jgi:hypothetical protein